MNNSKMQSNIPRLQKKRVKIKQKKRKAKVSKELAATETEVAKLLEERKCTDVVDSNDVLEQSLLFFTSTLQGDSPAETLRESSISSQNEDENILSARSVQMASSYIQIEDVELVCPFEKLKICFDDDLLYEPSAEVNDSIPNVYGAQRDSITNLDGAQRGSSANTVKMVNRFFEEGNLDKIASSSKLKNEESFLQDNELYKTECERVFEPILTIRKFNDHHSTSHIEERLLTISLDELRFDDHPLKSEEHILEGKLHQLYTSYWDKIQQNIIKKFSLELKALREIIQKYIAENNEQNWTKLSENMTNVKHIREKLHREEKAQKKLLKSILDTWILLKNLRKKQGFHYTNFKLNLKVYENNFENDEREFKERVQIEIGEVFREELQEYYKQKKNRDKGSGKLHKPKVETIARRVRENLEECIRLPGEPIVEVFKAKLDGICKLQKKIKEYYLKILFDGQLVGGTMVIKMDADFRIQIGETFGVYLKQRMPESIRISLYEKVKMSGGQKVANILIPLPTSTDFVKGFRENVQFSSHKYPISGILKLSLKCENSEEIMPQIRDNSQLELPKNVYREWVMNQQFNPLDIDRESILKELHPNNEEGSEKESDNDDEKIVDQSDDYFTFNEHSLDFCSKDEIASNERFRMLSARYNQDLRYKHCRLIPSFANEIQEESEDRVLDPGNWMDPIDLHKFKGKKHLRRLYEVIANHCVQMSRLSESTTDLLIGNASPNFGSIISALTSLFTPHRPLNPPKCDPPVLPLSQNIAKFNIVINVIRATGIPVRNFQTDLDQRSSNASTYFLSQSFKYSNVRPYVSVRYENKSVRTTAADGSSPTWNEQVVLQISGTPTELKDDLKIQLFDEYIEDLINDETSRSMEVYQRIHANWLGDYRLPINTLLKRHRVDGVFEITSPKLILGYTTPSLEQVETTIPMENVPEIREAMHIWLYISIEPNIELESIRTDSLECSELKEVKHHIRQWSLEVKELQPGRFVDPLICTPDGKVLCMTRLFEPIPLPIENHENILSYCKRYVSLLSVLKTTNPCTELHGVWLNNETILDTTWASAKDLATTLAGYYLNLGIRCWLALGMSNTHSETAFVLHQNESYEYFLVDPLTGRKYSVRDVYCPLIEIFSIVGQDNVYCNLQRETRVSMTSFNLNDSSLWMPLFTKSNPAPIGGFQKLTYSYSDAFSTVDLRRNIERKVMKKINSWRSTRKTIWNRAFHPVLYEVLQKLESDLIQEIDSRNTFADRIAAEFPNYKLFGFTLNFPYRNLSCISERVKATGIYLNMDRNVEFGLAVYVHSYPNNVISVWIFLISATPL